MRCLLLLWLVSTAALGQDSLVHTRDLKYRTEFERKAFRQWSSEHKPEVLLDLFLATDANPEGVYGNAKDRIDQIAARLAADPSSKKKPEKFVKVIYEQVHKNFLQKYELVNRYPEVFRTGNYNCVTATALYAMIFDKLNIPYSIQEKPTHVFLIAYPNQYNILVETTTPVFGYLNFDARYKQNFVDNLKAQKLIGNAEASSLSVEELFNRYYFQNENITLPQLAGLHYLNDALYYVDTKNLDEALHQIDKAYLLYPTPRVSYVMMGIVAQALTLQQPKPLERATLIARASQFITMGITPDMIKGEFAQLTNTVLTRDNNKTLYKQCFEIIFNGIYDQELKNDIGYYYNFELGRLYYNQGAYTQAKNYFARGLGFQPNNAELAGIFLNAVGNTMRDLDDGKSILDTLLRYQTKYPVLAENNRFQSMIAVGYLIAFKEAMHDGKPALGESYQTKFEALRKANPDLDAPREMIGSAYSAAGSYYFKKGQKAKARAILDRGLELAPGNYELRQRKQMIR